uniref:Uncharacterized protein n=1 Tax=Oryza barthii TaxID=65489 RepID=A0A0D3HM02_9ORYZ
MPIASSQAVLHRPRQKLTTYQLRVNRLKEKSKHKVLKRGATLGQELVESNTGWEKLEGFWSKMILYLAPSENLDGHKEAIARGGELITLLWAMLAHDGNSSRCFGRADC